MKTILKTKLADFIGIVYQNVQGGYYYKIYYQKMTKDKLINQSYVYLWSKEETIERMRAALNECVGITSDLFNLDKL